jgi:hypothetical protein
MTTLDDALNSSNPMFHPVEIIAEWKELPPGYVAALPNAQVENLQNLGQQIGPQGYTVDHSLDDGLPDPVTMTSSNDASGQMTADLVGRQANRADNAAFRTVMTGGTGTGTAITIAPNNSFLFDYSVVAVQVQASVLTYTTNIDPEDPFRWTLLASVKDGSANLLVFGRQHYTGAPSLVLTLSGSFTWVWTGVSATAETHAPARGLVPVKPGTVVTSIESVNQTPHTIGTATINRRGWYLAFFASNTSVGFDPAAGTDYVELSENAIAPRLMMMRSGFRTGANWSEVVKGVSLSGTDSVAMAAIPLEVMDRPQMDAIQYFSPFNPDSPLYGFERDTALVSLAQPVITTAGVESTQIFKGQMADIPMQGRSAQMAAISKTRIDLDKMLTLPTVFGLREQCTVDWLATWIMARGGQFAGPAPSVYCRYWLSLYGSVHPTLGGPLSFSGAYVWDSATPGVSTGRRYPRSDPGPFVSCIWNQYQDDLVYEIYSQADRYYQMPGGATELGYDAIPDHTNDILSQANNRGRISFWIRGDASVTSPAAIVGAPSYTNTLARYRAAAVNPSNVVMGEINVIIRENRNILLRAGDITAGYFEVELGSHPIPVDDAWHHVCVVWDWDSGIWLARMDNNTWTTSPGSWCTTNLASLPTTEEAVYTAGGYVYQEMRCRLPMSDIIVEWGSAVYTEGISKFWPSLSAPSGNATMRPTHQQIEAVAEATPVQGWETLADLAQASVTSYRTDEMDGFNFLPLSYFGESDQMTPTLVADTEVNTAELDVKVDPSKTRNLVTLEFADTSCDSKLSRVMQLTSALEIPRGVTVMTFAMDLPTAEVHGANAPYTGFVWDLIKLTGAQIAAPATIPATSHFMTVNGVPEGTGPAFISSVFQARIVGWDNSTVQIRFTNNYRTPLWLANNGTDVPVLCILGYAVRVNTAYTTQRDAGSIGSRRERALYASSTWVHNRVTAENVANTLVTMLSRPRAEVTIEVMGDPRRKPGQLVQLKDAQGTAADGTWRILSVAHNGSGAQFTQTLKMTQVYPVGVWDQSNWDTSVWAE